MPWLERTRTFSDKPLVTDFNDYEIRIEEAFRFNPEDTLVFHVTLRNKSNQEIRYLPEVSVFASATGLAISNPSAMPRSAAAVRRQHRLFCRHRHA